ncbi:hypothetical protein ACIBKZ_34275 [Streptomyces sp. NPDC050421]|uniref:hypothetical protein n=1 Tax=Streptomyces sp. NPDC050421 TaxID=3365613 RepID=UPI0037A2A23B
MGNSSTNVVSEPAAFHCRMSRADADEADRRRPAGRVCREIAERRGLDIDSAHVFVGNSRSARSRKRKRPGCDRLLEDARNRPTRCQG